MKWTPANAFAIKKDVERLQSMHEQLLVGVNLLKDEKKFVEEEIKRLREILETLDASASRKIDFFNQSLFALENKIQHATVEKDTLLQECANIKHILLLVRKKVVEALEEKDSGTSLHNSVITELSNKIEQLLFFAKVKENEVETLERRLDEKKAETEDVEKQKEELQKERDVITQSIVLARVRHENLIRTVERSETQLAELAKRERDVAIKERRLTPEYQAIYAKVNG